MRRTRDFAPFTADLSGHRDPASQPAQWFDFMHSLARLLAAKPVFIPADDIFVAALGRHADALGGSYILRSASVVQPLMDAEIEQICDSFLRSVGYVGICDIEVKRDARNGKGYLVEVNPRFSGTGDCASYTGVEIGWLHYLDSTDRTPAPVEASRLNFRHMTIRREIPSAIMYLEQHKEPPRSATVLLRSREYFDFDLRDWRVSAGTFKDCARTLVAAGLRRLRLRRQLPTPADFR